MKLTDIFDSAGNFTDKSFNPYRADRDNPIWEFLFDEEGFLRHNVSISIWEMMQVNSHYSPFSDIVKLYHADVFACNTHGNYSTIHYWR